MSTHADRTNANKMHFLHTYKFNWRKGEQDPVIDRVRTCMQDTGYDVARVARDSGLSWSTVNNWMEGRTIRPQYATICAAIRSMGFDFAVVPASHKANGKGWDASAPAVVTRFRKMPASERKLAGVSGNDLKRIA